MTRPEYIVAALLLLTTGCIVPEDFPPDERVCIAASVGGTSRTSISGQTTSFTAGDNIGVFETLTGRTNVPYTYNGTAWSASAPIYWRNGTSAHSFCAYYPYTTTTSGTKVQIPVLSTQTITTTRSTALDLLAAGPVSQTRSASVALKFDHAFAVIQLNIKMGVLQLINPYYLNRITIRGGNTSGTSDRYGIANITGSPAQVGYDVPTRTLVAATNDAASYAQTFYSDVTGVSLTTTNITFYAYILPGTYTNPRAAISFRITTLGITYNLDYANFPNTTFQAGNIYVYNASIGLLSRSSRSSPTLVLEETISLDEPLTKQPL